MKKKTIIIFMYNWRVCTIITNLIKSLNENGFKIIFFCYFCSLEIVDLSELSNKDITIYNNFNNKNKLFGFFFNNRFIHYLFSKIFRHLLLKNISFRETFLKLFSVYSVIPKEIIIKINQILCNKNEEISCFIGVEKEGLILSNIVQKNNNIPIYYYSYELYGEDHPYHNRNIFNAKVYSLEKYYHKNAYATIIQDSDRCNVLFNNNKANNKKIFLPVYNKGDIILKKSDYFFEKYNLLPKNKIILYLGTIISTRLIQELIEIFNDINNDNYKLVLHGPLKFDAVKYVKSKNIFISGNLVSNNELFELISSAYIGIAIYRQTNKNEMLTAFSSTKIAQYFRCGIPVITWDNYNFRKLMSEFKCGEMIYNYNMIENALDTISTNYDIYSANAFKAYNKYYNIDNTINNLIREINNE